MKAEDVGKEAPFKFAEKEDGLNPLLLGSVGLLLTFLLLIIGWLVKTQWEEAASRRRTAALLAMAQADDAANRREAAVAAVAGGRRRNVVRRRVNHDGDDFVNHMMGQQGMEGSDDEDGPLIPEIDGAEKMGAKKLAKMQAKAEKKSAREAMLVELEERKRIQKEEDEEREKLKAAEEEEERLEEERKKKEKEEKERREHEEYLKMKESFAVEEEGCDVVEGEEAENLIQQFIAYIKENKVVNMDELAAHFGLRSEEAVSRLHHFVDQGQLTGLMDERGKFIYITSEELEAVAKFVNQRGRISIAELQDYSNKLIRLEGGEDAVPASA